MELAQNCYFETGPCSITLSYMYVADKRIQQETS